MAMPFRHSRWINGLNHRDMALTAPKWPPCPAFRLVNPDPIGNTPRDNRYRVMAPIHDPKALSLTTATPVRDAIAVIDRGTARIGLVTGEDGRLLGTVTDGDIRRGLLKGLTLDDPVEAVMQRQFRFLGPQATETDALNLMRRDGLLQVPVLDGGGRVVRLYLLEDLLQPRQRPNTVVLMAGGKGERLRPLTADRPKPMLPVGGRPMLEIILDQCVEAGFGRFFLSVNYLKQQIIDHFGDGSRWGVEIRYLEEESPLGTGGALGLLPAIPDHPLLVMNGDVLTRIDFSQLMRFHDEHDGEVTMGVREYLTPIPYGVVQIEGTRVVGFREKPVLSHFVNAGIYVINPRVLDVLAPHEACDMPELLARVRARGGVVNAFPIHEYWLDVGHPETLRRADGEW